MSLKEILIKIGINSEVAENYVDTQVDQNTIYDFLRKQLKI